MTRLRPARARAGPRGLNTKDGRSRVARSRGGNPVSRRRPLLHGCGGTSHSLGAGFALLSWARGWPMSDRMRRVNEAVRQVLSEAVGELKDPRIGFVTVTGVETSPDLRHARVFVSVLGSEKQQQQSLTGLEAAHGVLQGRLARELRL